MRRYGAYKTLAAADGGITLAFRWSHMRREFIDLGRMAPIAQEILKRIAALYAVETELRGKPPDLRRVGRQGQSRPLVEALFASGDDGGFVGKDADDISSAFGAAPISTGQLAQP